MHNYNAKNLSFHKLLISYFISKIKLIFLLSKRRKLDEASWKDAFKKKWYELHMMIHFKLLPLSLPWVVIIFEVENSITLTLVLFDEVTKYLPFALQRTVFILPA